jgi:pyruvate/2-oxoglutarate dehydrogenase complex dihydrolipoamide dehydrogenase (E3) component
MADVLIIGGGPAGVTAALRARELGASVTLLESRRLGGTCTNGGCVPVRALAKAARLVRDAGHAARYGVVVSRPTVDFAAVMAKTQAVVEQVQRKKHLADHLRSCGVDVHDNTGDATFVDPHTLKVHDGRRFSGKTILLAVGGHPAKLPVPGGELAIGPEPAFWRMRTLPRRTIVVGASATGCQIATAFAAFGSHVTVIEQAPVILSTADNVVSSTIERAYADQGITVIADCAKGVTGIDRNADGSLCVTYDLGDGEPRTVEADLVFSAVGWPGNADRLNLAAAGLEPGKRGYLSVDEYQRTAVPHIFAAGDLDGQLLLVQTAYAEGALAAENMVRGPQRKSTRHAVPYGGFTDPEYGGVGLTEANARKQGHDVATAVVRYDQLDRAVIDGLTIGCCKLIVDRVTHKILGAHVVGEDAAEVVQVIAAFIATDATLDPLIHLQLSYPTYTAIVGLAARQLARELGIVDQQTMLSVPADWERGGG